MKKLLIAVFGALSLVSCQQNQREGKPKLVVGIVVDQMRQEYLYKYQDRFSEGGFKRLMSEGFMFQNAHYNYTPTYTGPGHASVYTGTTPANHGIIANDWYVRQLGRSIYCAEDSLVSNVGGSAKSGKISPRNMRSTTITDQLRLATGKQAKVVGVAIKDRGASLPAGHMGDAYWLDKATGEFMTSTYYTDVLPQWAQDFNAQKRADHYLSQTWETLYPIETYTQSTAGDDNDFEGPFIGKDDTAFPYDLSALKDDNGGYDLVASTPYGNDLTLEMAKAAIEGEQLGQGDVTDFLALSFSSPDYIGHRFGPSSVELEDNYLRLDLALADFLAYLDQTVGEGNYLIFLTADHGVADIPDYMQSENIPAGGLDMRFITTQLRGFTNDKFGPGNWIENVSNDQIFFNRKLAAEKGISIESMQRQVADFLLRFDGIKETYTGTDMMRENYSYGKKQLLQMGYSHKYSGDVIVILEPAWLSSSWKGTTHGSGYTYDTHVPVMFYGWGVRAGRSSQYHTITDIAPTLAVMLEIGMPNATTGQPLTEILD
ncbi:alkaline phosphatase PafA [Penaeicola halotolerans]|uniref:alkaline phosphatase PafA n=1 Tax=Penaeicola halotolerans TaxID=2793196 RepID=UPI001CF8FF2C|nr:alkaline phosphatase PafA [Penaeicola halotolerans]